MSLSEVFVEIGKRHLVGRLVLAVVVRVLLNCVVGQMDVFAHILCCVFF
jgi:hypothetical protein